MITFLRGTSGSGKTYYASQRLAANPKKVIIISRDNIRAELLGADNLRRYYAQGMDNNLEDMVTRLEHKRFRDAALDDLRIYNYDREILVDNLNIKRKYIEDYISILETIDYSNKQVCVKDFEAPIEVCVERCAERASFPVPQDVIERQATDLQKDKWALEQYRHDSGLWDGWLCQCKRYYRPNFPTVPYTPNPDLPKAIICDLDGTLAHRTVLDDDRLRVRCWYGDEQDIVHDAVDQSMLAVLNALALQGYKILFVSGRKEEARKPTEVWLNKWLGTQYELFMRDRTKDIHDGYHDADDKVKYRIFNESIRDNYDVRMVFDDRKRVIALWQDLGLKVFSVGDVNDEF